MSQHQVLTNLPKIADEMIADEKIAEMIADEKRTWYKRPAAQPPKAPPAPSNIMKARVVIVVCVPDHNTEYQSSDFES